MEGKNESKLILGLVPCLNNYFLDLVWPVIKPYVTKLAALTGGEYDIYKVWQDIYFGQAHLYVVYETTDADATQDKFQEKIVKCLQTPEKDFVGYAIVRFEPRNAHVWQAYITDKHQNSAALSTAFDYLVQVMKNVGAPYVTFSTQREGWQAISNKLGFREAYTVYRKELR